MNNLLPQHHELLRASVISDAVADARGYYSATTREQLEDIGFRPRQQNVPALVIPIRDVRGTVVLHQIRPDRPRITKKGKELKYESPYGSSLVIDVHPMILDQLGNPAKSLWITEGSRKVDSAISAGLCSVGLLGVWGWRGTNEQGGKTALACWESIALNNRDVFIAFDSDAMTKDAVNLALHGLRRFLEQRGAKVKLVYLPAGKDGEKVGLDDFIASGNTVDDLLACVQSPETKTGQPKGKKEEAQVQKILGLIGETDVELFHDAEPRPYITFSIGNHRETHPLDSKTVRRWLAHSFYLKHGCAPNQEALSMARLTMEGEAQFEGPQREVALRIAFDRGAIVLDLCDEEWKVVRIDAAGWNLLTSSPVRFRRSAGMLPLPVPERGGSLEELRMFVNVGTDDDLLLLIAWLVGAARPEGPYPVLVLSGEQGSAKSTTARVLRRLIDPNKAEIRAEPKNREDLAIAANNGFVIALDNVSSLPPWLSDALCRLSTGGGFATRQLYTNMEEAIFDATRPIILNGIEDFVVRGDLLDRAITLTLPQIDEKQRQPEEELWQKFTSMQPRLLGTLLDAVSTALRRRSEVSLNTAPRMADFAAWVVAAEPALPCRAGGSLKVYMANQEAANEFALEASPVAPVLIPFLDEVGTWTSNYKDLLSELERRAPDTTKGRKSWPRTPRGLSAALRRLAPNLRRIGIGIEFGSDGRGKQKHRVVRLNSPAQPPPPTLPSPVEEKPEDLGTYKGQIGDGCGDGLSDSGTDRPHNRPPVSPGNDSEGDGEDSEDDSAADFLGGAEQGGETEGDWGTL